MRKFSKKLFAAITVFCFCFLAIASGSDEPKKETSSGGNAAETTQASEETFALNETAVFSTLKITANEIKTSKGNDYNKPESGNIFVGVKFTIENISNEDQTISSILLFDCYADDVKTDLSIMGSLVFDNGTLDGTLSSGKKMVGYYAIEVPSDTSKIDFEVKSSWLSSSKAKFTLTVPK